MQVQELIEILESLDPKAEVYLMTQRQWPFEYSLTGVTVRSDFTEVDTDAPLHERGDRWAAHKSSLPGNDVFLLEGDQLHHGDAAAWDAARR